MRPTLFFYDLETSGIRPDSDRIMQFAGQRTDYELKPIGEPINQLIRMTPDILPDPLAIMVHGISPQQTIDEGISEADFVHVFQTRIVQPNTTFVGFNNLRFDDEFMRYFNYRNLSDPYEWSYANHNSRWDILDVVRLTRALRPEGINWPTNKDGVGINKLTDLTRANHLPHLSAHDALSDVSATIAVAKLIKQKQPKLYDYLFNLRQKSAAAKLINSGQPFVHTSWHYPATQLHTSIVRKVADHPSPNCMLVFDLRHDPQPWLNLSIEQLLLAWRFVKNRSADDPPLPVRTIRLNRCPAIAPVGVINSPEVEDRLGLSLASIQEHNRTLENAGPEFGLKLVQAVKTLNGEQGQRQATNLRESVEQQLYAGFYSERERKLLNGLHQKDHLETAAGIRELSGRFEDERLKRLSELYLWRNYSKDLTNDERKAWDQHVRQSLLSGGNNSRLANYFRSLNNLSEQGTDRQGAASFSVLLEDLRLYGESLIPSDMIG
jgi:exodeoxyribonuclease-1